MSVTVGGKSYEKRARDGKRAEEEIEHIHAHIKIVMRTNFFTDTINFHMTRKFILL